MTPRSQAIAFRIWQHCEPIGWDCNIKDVADALGVSWKVINGVAVAKGWNTRFRKDTPDSLSDGSLNGSPFGTISRAAAVIAEYAPQELEE